MVCAVNLSLSAAERAVHVAMDGDGLLEIGGALCERHIAEGTVHPDERRQHALGHQLFDLHVTLNYSRILPLGVL
jgi:hypothetical protein